VRKLGLLFVRYGIAILMVIAGIVAYEQGPKWQGFGVVVMGFGLCVVMINGMFRLSLKSNTERDVEEDAREFYAEHGYWPDEAARQDVRASSSR